MTIQTPQFAKPQTLNRTFALFFVTIMTCALAPVFSTNALAADNPPEAQVAAVATPNYKVTESISIDRLIQKIYANSPLSVTVLRKVLVDANPKVITGNPQQRVKGGTAIVVPDHAEVVRSTLTPFIATAQDAADQNPTARDYQARKQWVRFP